MKAGLRNLILDQRRSLKKKGIYEKSLKIKEKLFGLEEYKSSKVVMFYVSFDNEVFTHDMIKESISPKTVAVPKVIGNEIIPSIILDFEQLSPSNFGVLEPVESAVISPKAIDLVLVPGIAFDKHGHRLGYGYGYYDKFLKKVRKAVKIGLAFDFQVVEKIPKETHDVCMDLIITDKDTVRTN